MFGEKIAIATNREEAREQLELLLGDPELAARHGHAAMRHVLAEHTYGHRVDEVLRVAGLERHVLPDEPRISVAVALDSAEAPVRLFEQLAAQAGQPLELLLAPCAADADARAAAEAAGRAGLADVRALAPADDRAAALDAAARSAAGALLAVVDPGCSYGERFLDDLAAAFAYTDAAVIGKAVDGPIAEHAYGAALHPASLLVRAEVAREVGFGGTDPDPGRNLLAGCEASGRRTFAADRYSFEPVAALSRD